MQSVKNPIKIGDEVSFLYAQFLMKGVVKKINKLTYKVACTPFMGFSGFTQLVTHDRVAHINDEFTVVWEKNRGVSGAYRLDYSNYPTENGSYEKWSQPYMYVTE